MSYNRPFCTTYRPTVSATNLYTNRTAIYSTNSPTHDSTKHPANFISVNSADLSTILAAFRYSYFKT